MAGRSAPARREETQIPEISGAGFRRLIISALLLRCGKALIFALQRGYNVAGFLYRKQPNMAEYANVLNFSEALLLTERGQQIAETKRRNRSTLITQKPVRMSCCHDGVWRVLAEAPKFRSGGITFDWTGPEPVIKPNFKHGFPG